MAVVVSFGLLIATFLMLVVVLYFLNEGLAAGLKGIERGKVAVYRVLMGKKNNKFE